MANKMLIDATHPEETRVVVLRGNRVEEFDFESAQRKQLRGNIYLAKVTRVEPSLQAAFVDYGGNRHGFLAFSEIHPDYYQIPVADRQALIDEDHRAQRAADDEDDRRSRRHRGRGRQAAARRDDEAVHGEPAEAARRNEPPPANWTKLNRTTKRRSPTRRPTPPRRRAFESMTRRRRPRTLAAEPAEPAALSSEGPSPHEPSETPVHRRRNGRRSRARGGARRPSSRSVEAGHAAEEAITAKRRRVR